MHADVVVVGAGAAGCVVAARLSERAGRSVLLLEAGRDGSVAAWPELVASRTAAQEPSPYLRGQGVGGSAALNAMVATVGEPDDYDEWERLYRCAGWGWRDVRPWFKRMDLPRRRARKRELGPLAAAVLSSASIAERARLTRTSDGRRASVNEVYLEPARRRSNLQVRGDALVDRVLFDGRRAVGVQLASGEVIDASTVVVCAGALHTPAVLLRSAVEREGIGQNLHDHASISLSLAMRVAANESGIAISVLATASHVDSKDVQIIPFEAGNEAALMAAAMRVYSRGHVHIAGSDPTVDPVIEINMLADERDRALLSAAAQQAVAVARRRAVASVATAEEVSITDEWLLGAVGDYVHAAGTCRMGAVDDPMAVVDNRCRVIGYEALLVCDASVMPNLPRANPCLPTVMIAERVSAMIDDERHNDERRRLI